MDHLRFLYKFVQSPNAVNGAVRPAFPGLALSSFFAMTAEHRVGKTVQNLYKKNKNTYLACKKLWPMKVMAKQPRSQNELRFGDAHPIVSERKLLDCHDWEM